MQQKKRIFYKKDFVISKLILHLQHEQLMVGGGKRYLGKNSISIPLKNAKFRKTFISKYKKHLETTFSKERIEAVFDSITAIVSTEYCVSFNSSAEEDVASMRRFALGRTDNILKQMDGYLGDVEGVEEDKDITTGIALFYYLPQQQKTMILTEENIISVSIYNISGKKLSEEMVGDTYYEYDMSKFGRGIYIINARFEKGTVSKKVLVEGF